MLVVKNGDGDFAAAGFVGPEIPCPYAVVPPPEELSGARRSDEFDRQPAADQQQLQQLGLQEDVAQARQEEIQRNKKSSPRRRCAAEGRRRPGDGPGDDFAEGPILRLPRR